MSSRSPLDPRLGDAEDDASSTENRSILALTGSLLSEISFPRLAAATLVLIVLPALLLGITPPLVSAWVMTISGTIRSPTLEIWPNSAARSIHWCRSDLWAATFSAGRKQFLVPECPDDPAQLCGLSRDTSPHNRTPAFREGNRDAASKTTLGHRDSCGLHSLRTIGWGAASCLAGFEARAQPWRPDFT